ncbi:MAG: hypothetical protein H6594_02630 [Flavobacteriales bacterium]|nr:hypothetical protein [Flavobacteriales bacterium]
MGRTIRGITAAVLLGTLLLISGPAQAQYTVLSQYGNFSDCDTMTRGIYIVWWDNNWNLAANATVLLDSMSSYRNVCLDQLGMFDPPNPMDGHYYNIYLHQSGDLFPSWFGNGQGTDQNGYPYLTLPGPGGGSWVNVAHETFHIFQYSANSPGFAYNGDSQWYIEASANWFAARQNPGADRVYVEGESLVRLPHVPLWLSYDNFPAYYPQNWQRYVHQYAMAMFLTYMSDFGGVPETDLSHSFYVGTTELPQEYFFDQLGGSAFRTVFIDWAAHMTDHFDFLPANQIAALENEWVDYADPLDDNEFIATFLNAGSNGWSRPVDSLITTGWSFNTYRLYNTQNTSYTFELAGDATGSAGSPTYFQGLVIIQSTVNGTSFHDLNMQNDQDGELTLALAPTDTTAYFIIASMPEVFTGVDQRYGYDMRISASPVGIAEEGPAHRPARIVSRHDMLGREVAPTFPGVQVLHYDDGSVRKVVVRR